MADKNVVVTEPTTNELRAITMILVDGAIAGVEIAVSVESPDPNVTYQPTPLNLKSRVTEYSATVQRGLAALPAEAIAVFNAKEGF